MCHNMCVRFFFIFFFFLSSHSWAQFSLDVETGAVFDGYNDIKVSGDEGTFISFSEDLTTLTKIFYRLRFSYLLHEKHVFSVLFAPLTLRAEGNFGKELLFQNTTFPQDSYLNGEYQFNSYRATYRYMFPRTRRFQWGIGATAKIRDARIAIENENQRTEKTNVGFVPLINFMAAWMVKDRLSVILAGDALIAPKGRAEDILLAAIFYPNKHVSLKMGYRVLEGGADNDEVYNFTLLHYAVIGGVFTF